MLVLSRKKNDEIVFIATAENLRALADRIGDGEAVFASSMIVEVRGDKVRLGFEFPDEIKIMRPSVPGVAEVRRAYAKEGTDAKG